MKKRVTLWLTVALSFVLAGSAMAEDAPEAQTEAVEAAQTEAYEEEEIFADWNQDAPALQTLIDYVETVTDESSEDYIPPVDRIAVFDMDGTICGELYPTYLEYYALAWRILKDPSIEPDAEMLAIGREIRDHALDKSFPEDMPMQHAIQAARAYSGMTLNEFSDFITEILLRDVDGFEGMTYGEALYSPILEVIEYLADNDFKVYIVSGSDRFLCRTLFEGHVDIPEERIIGMDVAVEATHQGDVDGLDYVYSADDEVVRTDRLLIKNLKMNKVCQIVREIGRQPVLSFGNSSGDVSMHNFTIHNNKYKSAAFMLVADDSERDYGDPEKTEPLKEKWAESGYQVISMRDDFRTIYGDDVVKTGTFRWMDELADDRGEGSPVFKGAHYAEKAAEDQASADAAQAPAAEASADAAQAPAAEASADTAQAPAVEAPADAAQAPAAEPAQAADGEDAEVQYIMYLGTNDKDTNEPVASREACMEKAKAILIDMFGGYTIQEAEGGWKDENGEVAQEYTLVIYLNDTTSEQVHAAADIMLDEFHQSSVMILENPLKTEFYGG